MEKKEDFVSSAVVRIVLTGTVVSIILCFLILMLAAATVVNGIFSQQSVFSLTLVSAFLGVFLGTYISLRKHKGRRWVIGLAIGLSVFFLFFVLGLAFSFPPKGDQLTRVMMVSLSAGFLGGLPKFKTVRKRGGHRR